MRVLAFSGSLTINLTFVTSKRFNKLSGLVAGLPLSCKSLPHVYIYRTCSRECTRTHTRSYTLFMSYCASLCIAECLVYGVNIPSVRALTSSGADAVMHSG